MPIPLRDPVIRPVKIAELRPTQITVGFREVERKRRKWAKEDKKEEELANHLAPVVLGPGGVRYIVDHHHLARALCDEGQDSMFVTVVGDLTKADAASFWNLMDYHGWTHPFDEKGRRCDCKDLPPSIAALRDDPYRSLSGALRRKGGYAKDSTPYSEFVWADYFRLRVTPDELKTDFDAALAKAMKAAKSEDTDFLPGWCGED